LLLRFAGATQEQIVSWGEFLNYGITWDSAESLFAKFNEDAEMPTRITQLLEVHDRMVHASQQLASPAPPA